MLGSGTELDPYQVATASDLDDVRNDLSAHYIQMADIDLSEYGDWIPIGEFNGVYDGNNFTISNLTVPLGDESIYYSWGLFEGIFGFWDMDFPENSVPAEVKNLTLENVNITGDYDVGALAGYSYGKITNCHSSGIVRGQYNVGGLIGVSYEFSDVATEYQSDIIGCSSSCSLERTDFTTYAYYFGGLIGSANNLRIEQCFATGDIISPISDNHLRNCGGLLGTASPWNIPLDMRMTIKDCYATGNIQGDYNCGGMVGYTYTCDLINCYSSGSVNGVGDFGGFIGYADTNTVTSCYYDSETSGQSDNDGRGTPKTTAQMKQQETFTDWDFNTIWGINSNINDGYPYLLSNPPLSDVIEVWTAEDLYNVRNNLSGNYIQMADIDLSGYPNWEPIGTESVPFTGDYDGNGYKICNLTIDKSDIDYIGLFGCVSGYTQEMDDPKWVRLNNIALVDVSISGCYFVGALLGDGYYAIINKCFSTGSVIGEGSVGGIAGYLWHFEEDIPGMTNSYSKCSVISTNDYDGTGGIVGVSMVPIVKCYSAGAVSSSTGTTDWGVGGLIGEYYSIEPVINSYYDSQVSGQSDTGKGEPKTTAEMKTQSTFVGWDFDTIWGISPNINDGYPYFIGSGTPTTSNIFTNVFGTWYSTTPYINVGGIWKPLTANANINNIWK